MSRITVVGSCAMDLTVEADRRPQAGETVMGKRLVVSPGGKGANQAVAAARLGAEVYMVGCVGDDAYGEMILKNLQANGVHTDYVAVLPGITSGTAHIVLAEGDNSIIVIKGANDHVEMGHIDKAWPVIRASSMVLFQHEIPLETIGYCIGRCAEEGVPVILNPAPVMDIPHAWADQAAYVTPNQFEAEALYPGMSREEILTHRSHHVIMTLGKSGVAYGEDGHIMTVPGFSVPVTDTTGAGDTFNGAFAVAVSERQPIHEAIRFANGAAALSIQKIGAQGGMPRREEVEDMLASCKK